MKAYNKSKTIVLIFFVLALVLVFIDVVVYKLIDKKINTIQTTLSKKYELQQQLKLNKGLNTKSSQVVKQVQNYCLDQDSSISFLDYLEKTIKSHAGAHAFVSGTNIESLSNGQIIKLKVPITTEGDINQVLESIKVLETVPYIAQLDSITLENTSRAWRLSTTLNVYMCKINPNNQ